MNKLIPMAMAIDKISEGASIMIGGFMGCGSPHSIIDALVKKGTGNLIVYCNDAAWPGYGVAKLITSGQVKKLYATHVGLNPEVAQKMATGELEVHLIPQGTMVEQIRAGGNGTGGVITPTGVGTIAAENKQSIIIDGVQYLLEKPIRADLALICGHNVDELGNIWYKGSTRNFNPIMATAAEVVIAEADNYVKNGSIEPENVVTSGIFVSFIVNGGVQ